MTKQRGDWAKKVPGAAAAAWLWKARGGDAQVEVYDPGGGVPYYIAKMFAYGEMRYDLGGLEHFAGEDSPIRGSGKWLN
jgi:hypothetical protein